MRDASYEPLAGVPRREFSSSHHNYAFWFSIKNSERSRKTMRNANLTKLSITNRKFNANFQNFARIDSQTLTNFQVTFTLTFRKGLLLKILMLESWKQIHRLYDLDHCNELFREFYVCFYYLVRKLSKLRRSRSILVKLFNFYFVSKRVIYMW